MVEEIEELRARAAAALALAATTQDRDIADLLLQVSEEFEEEACVLERARGQA